MRQIGTYIRNSADIGAWLQPVVAQAADMIDTVVTLADATTTDVIVYSSAKEIQKYVPLDSELLGRGKIVSVFVFKGVDGGRVREGDLLTFEGVQYRVDVPMHPDYVGGTLISLAVVAYVP